MPVLYLSSRQRAAESLRYLVDDSDFTITRFFPQFPNLSANRKTLATIEERKFIGSNIVNEARFGFNRSTPSELVPDPGFPVSFIAGRPLGELNVTGKKSGVKSRMRSGKGESS